VPAGTSVSVNGRQVQGLIALRPGDSVGFDQVQAKLAALGPPPVVARQSMPGPDLMSANDDPGVTAVRPVLPRFFLRSVSAELGNRSDALVGVLTVGRGPDCNLRFDTPGLSRTHARLIPTDTGVQVEDLGSSNGTFLNGKRILRGEAKVGDELAFDVLRFRVAGASDARTGAGRAQVDAQAETEVEVFGVAVGRAGARAGGRRCGRAGVGASVRPRRRRLRQAAVRA
jgi:hypothetical protein